MKTYFLTVAMLVHCAIFAQYSPTPLHDPVDRAAVIANTITAEDISEYLHVLADDAFEGRETGTPGNVKAAYYIAGKFEDFGIPKVESLDSYYQEVMFSRVHLEEARCLVEDVQFRNLRDFVVVPDNLPANSIEVEADRILFLGYGIDDEAYSDYRGRDVEGKTILIYDGEPVDENGKSWITGTTERSHWSTDLEAKLRAANRHGVSAVLIVEDAFRFMVGSQRRSILRGKTVMGMPKQMPDVAPSLHLSSNMVEAILGKKTRKVIRARDKISRKGKNKRVRIRSDVEISIERDIDITPGVNVLGYIEGTDPELRDELVVITAHYDHVGMRGDAIFNGADDNASGTSGVLEIAQAFAEAKNHNFGPRRSVLCMLVTGEEMGLLGSEYYSENPVFPLENTVANINMDMIGRQDAVHDSPDYIYVIGGNRMSTDLHAINEEVNDRYIHFELDYTYNAEDDPNRFFYRSDHYNFAKHGIPVLFYFSGVHEDYHRPSDTVDKIIFDRAEKVARLAFHVAWEVANRDERVKLDRGL